MQRPSFKIEYNFVAQSESLVLLVTGEELRVRGVRVSESRIDQQRHDTISKTADAFTFPSCGGAALPPPSQPLAPNTSEYDQFNGY